MKSKYVEFLERLIYSIDHVDWGDERIEKMIMLLESLDKEYGPWTEEVAEYQKRVDAEIGHFEKGEICECDLMERLTEIKKEVM